MMCDGFVTDLKEGLRIASPLQIKTLLNTLEHSTRALGSG